MTLALNFENCYILPNIVLNFLKSYQTWRKLAKEQKSYKQKTNWGVKNTTPSAYRVNQMNQNCEIPVREMNQNQSNEPKLTKIIGLL